MVSAGAALVRLERFLPDDPPGDGKIDALRTRAAAALLDPVARTFPAQPRPDHVVGSSKAIRSPAKLAG